MRMSHYMSNYLLHYIRHSLKEISHSAVFCQRVQSMEGKGCEGKNYELKPISKASGQETGLID